MTRTITCIIAAMALAGLAAADNEPVGSGFTYQGRLTQQGQPVTQPADFVFRLFDAEAEGTQLGALVADGLAPDDDGRFTIDLDFGDGAFTGAGRWLEISVNGTTLNPRQPIMPAPHAMVATTAANVPVKAVVGSYGGITGVGTLDSLNVGGNVGIGTTSPQFRLHVQGGNIYSESGSWAVRGVKIGSGTFPGVWGETESGSGGASGVRGFVNHETPGANAAGVYGHNFGTNDNGMGVRGIHDAGGIGVYGQSATGIGMRGHTNSATGYAGYFTGGRNYFEGRVGIGTDAPSTPLHVSHNFSAARFEMTGTGNSRALYATSTGSGAAVEFHVPPSASATALYSVTYGSGRAALFESHQSNDTATINIFKNNGPALRVAASLSGGTADTSVPVAIIGGSNAQLGGGGFLTLGSTAGTNVVFDNNEIMARNNGDVSNLHLNKNGGHVVIGTFSGGTGRLVTPVLEITGGSDLSERFNVTGVDELTPQPGMVVCIDPASPGELRLSTRAYDRAVAGVISGANGVRTGMIMGQRDSEADGAYPVALTGRVYVMVDASIPGSGPIEPGDLLTTSDTPGHAMKVTDFGRAQGAIIGKAMTCLDVGERGMVLVLVSLQ